MHWSYSSDLRKVAHQFSPSSARDNTYSFPPPPSHQGGGVNMVQPKLISEILRQRNPRTFISQTNSENVTQASWQPSQQHTQRQRSQSVKRKNTSDSAASQRSYANATSNSDFSFSGIATAAAIFEMEQALTKAKLATNNCRKLSEDLNSPEQLTALFENFFETFNMLISSQESVIGLLKNSKAAKNAQTQQRSDNEGENSQDWQPQMVTLGQIAKRQKSDNSQNRFPQPVLNSEIFEQAEPIRKQGNPPETDRERKIRKFKAAVDEAESSTLVMNLNLGKTKLINQETISTNVSAALTEMAALAEGKKDGVPSAEATAQLDDIISVATDMEFFGKTTRSVRNKKDQSLNGSYCTIPVKYKFPDKDTKIYAEDILRHTCKAQCATPYPPILRDAIKQIIEEEKDSNPGHLIRVKIDVGKMVFKTARKAKDGRWENNPKHIPIPDECLDVDAKTVPENFKVQWPTSPSRTSRKDQHERSRIDSPTSGGSQDGPP